MIESFFIAIIIVGISLLFPTAYAIFATAIFSAIALYLLYKLGFFIVHFKKYYAERKAMKMFKKYHNQDKYERTGHKVQWGNSLNKDDKRLIRFQYRINKILASIYHVNTPPRTI